MVEGKKADISPLGGGPLGFGDPDDKRLRKAEKDIILPKMLREEARKKCNETFDLFYECSKNSGLGVVFKCVNEKNAFNDCLSSWVQNPDFVEEVTNKYLENRKHFRLTGEAVEKYKRIQTRTTC